MRKLRSLRRKPPARAVATIALLGLAAGPAGAMSYQTVLSVPGEAANDGLGSAVAPAGDLNGDGWQDLVIGAPGSDAGGSNSGRAYVLFGGPGADDVPDLVFGGLAAGDSLGYTVASAGDFNADGFDDLAIGTGDGDEVQIHFGGLSPDTSADLTLTGEAAGDRFGFSVASVGDFSGDGYDDLLVGAPRNDALGTDAGRAYVFFGGPSPNATIDLTLYGNNPTQGPGDEFGCAVAGPGDVNGDGIADLVVGGPGYDNASSDVGAAWVFFGKSGHSGASSVWLGGTSPGARSGAAVSSAGDVNGDGHADFLIGAPGSFGGAGSASVFFGGPSLLGGALVLTDGENGFGTAVSPAGDVNRDGYADLLVGSPFFQIAPFTNQGAVYIYFGSPNPDSVADMTLTGAGDGFGRAIAAAGDFDGNGTRDLLLGAPSASGTGTSAGRADVVSIFHYELIAPNGGETWIAGANATVRWRGHDPADLALSLDGGLTWETRARNVGGLEENAHSILVPAAATDFAVVRLTYAGQTPASSNAVESKRPFRIRLPAIPAPAVHRLQLVMRGEAASDRLGTSVAGAGDVNGDGYADVIIGAPWNSSAGASAGEAYVLFGGPSADSVPDLTLSGEAAGDQFGNAVAAAGDVNGDGYDDLIVGAYLNGAAAAAAGRAYLYFGGPAADAVADLVLTGATANEFFGFSVATAGDVNGDGFDDFLIGALENYAGGTGSAYLYFGGPAADSSPDLVLNGEGVNDFFGISVASAGDLDADGFADLVVGAYRHDATGADAGAAYVYYGGVTPDAVPERFLTGEAPGDNFGVSVRTAGDVNGDGFADLVVGAYRSNAGGAGSGRVYLYFGGSSGLTPALTLTGQPGEEIGVSVGTAGDVNGDGFPDLLVGAYRSDAVAVNAGRAYVYHGGPGLDATPDVTLAGEAAGDYFGISVAAAGDVNGDGFGDLLVGAQYNGASGALAGAAYLFDCNRYFVTSPAGGETWSVGATETISWRGREPADVWLSPDGGATFNRVKSAAGGNASNTVSLLVPHLPTKFATVRITPSDPAVRGSDASDSLFTVDAAIALLAFQVVGSAAGGPGAAIRWTTDPGPEDLQGYRLERADGQSGRGSWKTLLEMTRDTSHVDRDATPGSRYRLTAVNGLGGEYVLGEATFGTGVLLSARPLPFRGSELTVTFATLGGFGGGPGPATVTLHDVRGRRVRTLARGDFPAGSHKVTWDGRDETGRRLAAGVYFLRVETAGNASALKVPVIR